MDFIGMEAKTAISKASNYIKSREFDLAIPLLKKLVETEKDNELVLGMLASVYAEIGMKDKAEDLYTQVLAINPENPLARFHLGLLHFTSDQYDEALAVWEPGLHNHSDFMLHYYCGLVYLQNNKTDKAKALLLQAEKFMPNSHPLFSTLRDTLANMGVLH